MVSDGFGDEPGVPRIVVQVAGLEAGAESLVAARGQALAAGEQQSANAGGVGLHPPARLVDRVIGELAGVEGVDADLGPSRRHSRPSLATHTLSTSEGLIPKLEYLRPITRFEV